MLGDVSCHAGSKHDGMSSAHPIIDASLKKSVQFHAFFECYVMLSVHYEGLVWETLIIL